ncbi:hypothetical protein [Cohnella sp. REN36]|uniref:hypothetical protein n=1 Tax=Cohnella sp. REN36 TaxID=2887347 RepID=UPI001D154C5A|nr:hypothetical protein [Cohnella sp. REN36]MCC3374062.1 hypothetical protein [Cohnella sp. REN36]
MELNSMLKKLYNDESKHSRYQNIPKFVREAANYSEEIDESWRGDTARYEYVKRTINIDDGEIIADIGANTGFFTLSLANENKNAKFIAYEPNINHAAFISEIADHFQLSNVEIRGQSIGLKEINQISVSDRMILFNVLHHAGVDFDKELVRTKADFKEYAFQYLNQLRKKTKQLLFQIGYNWGGDKSNPIVDVNHVSEMTLYVSELFMNAGWQIKTIAFYSYSNKKGLYEDIHDDLLRGIIQNARDASVIEGLEKHVHKLNMMGNSEFYKRPIFVFES